MMQVSATVFQTMLTLIEAVERQFISDGLLMNVDTNLYIDVNVHKHELSRQRKI